MAHVSYGANPDHTGGVSVYTVGLFDAVFRDYVRVRHAHQKPVFTKRSIVRMLNDIRRHKWRELKNEFNGFLAEPYYWPDELIRCGSGWTKRRALRSLHKLNEQIPISHKQQDVKWITWCALHPEDSMSKSIL